MLIEGALSGKPRLADVADELLVVHPLVHVHDVATHVLLCAESFRAVRALGFSDLSVDPLLVIFEVILGGESLHISCFCIRFRFPLKWMF